MRKLPLLLALSLALPAAATAQRVDGINLYPLEEEVRPGKAVLVSFEAATTGQADLWVEDTAGNRVSVVVDDFPAQPGLNRLYWNGTHQGAFAPAGDFTMVLEQGGDRQEAPITIGEVAPYMTQIESTGTVTPETPLTVSFFASTEGAISYGVFRDGLEWVLVGDLTVMEGQNTFTWDGVVQDDAPMNGQVTLTLQLTDLNGFEATEEHLPVMVSGFEEAVADPADGASAEMDVLPAPTPLARAAVAPGADAPADSTATPSAQEEALPDGFALAADGEELLPADMDVVDDPAPDATPAPAVEEEAITLEEALEEVHPEETPAPVDQSQFTPSYGSPYAATGEGDYWTTPMDITDEAAIWAMLMKPVTVIDGNPKTQVTLRKEPREDSQGVGVITRDTQSLRVIEDTGDGWTLIETYSSSFHDNKVKAWNMLVQGYVKTSTLKTVTPDGGMGLVVDKLSQRLYVFKEGNLFTTLAISTGLANDRQPYNETRSGEFLLVSRVGEFQSDNLYCSMAIRFNDGDLLHEVPHTKNGDGTKNYRNTEAKLGSRASHGCIRVQRNKTPEGVNMTWLWKNWRMNTKIVIWEDWQGRQLPYPAEDTTLYYNPDKGTQYHTSAQCLGVVEKHWSKFQPFTYGELETDAYRKLVPCPYCAPPMRKAEIDAINEAHAPGGDHDPVMTKARQKYLDAIGQ